MGISLSLTMIHWGATEYCLHITHEETKALKGSDLVKVMQPLSRRTWTKTVSLWGQLLASVHDTGVPRGALWADPALHGWPGRVVGIWWGKRANMMWYGNCLWTGWLSLIFPRSVLALGLRTGPHTHNWSGQSGDEGLWEQGRSVGRVTENETTKDEKGWIRQQWSKIKVFTAEAALRRAHWILDLKTAFSLPFLGFPFSLCTLTIFLTFLFLPYGLYNCCAVATGYAVKSWVHIPAPPHFGFLFPAGPRIKACVTLSNSVTSLTFPHFIYGMEHIIPYHRGLSWRLNKITLKIVRGGSTVLCMKW